jgi:hypothetical protein
MVVGVVNEVIMMKRVSKEVRGVKGWVWIGNWMEMMVICVEKG